MKQESAITKGLKMREIQYKNLTSPKNGRRVISVSEINQNKDCCTHVHKAFIYLARKEEKQQESVTQPVFHIFKSFNTKTKVEKFYFRVKGMFYVVKDIAVYTVYFCHSLRIDITHKAKSVIG